MRNSAVLRNKLNYLIYFLFLVTSFNIQAQDTIMSSDTPNPFWNKVRFGGSLGLSFGNGNFTGALAPAAIYDFNKTLSAGVGLSAAYASQSNFKTTSLGGSLIGMLRPFRGIQLSTEFEQLHINRRYELEGGNLTDQYWVPALFFGIGYTTGPVVAGIRYDVLHDSEKSFYGNALMPFVSVYF